MINAIDTPLKREIYYIPLAFAGFVTGCFIVFFTVFANPLLGRATEKALEGMFDARADVQNFRLNVFRFFVSIDRVAVADRDKPMTNLFEVEKPLISLNPAALLRGSIYINELSAASIRLGTPRTVSGALPAKPAKAKPERPKSETPPLIDLKNFDVMALFNREYEKLNTPRLYDEAIAAYNEMLEKYQGQAELTGTQNSQLQELSQPLLAINASALRDVQIITRTVQDTTALVNTVQVTAENVTQLLRGLEADIKLAQALEQSARTALTDDINRLKSYADIGSGAAFAALEPSIREILSDTGEKYLSYGIRVLEVLERLTADKRALDLTEPARAGTVQVYPKFYLGRIASDFTLDNRNWVFDMRHISSDPDITGDPVTLALDFTEDGSAYQRQAGFRGKADFRANPGVVTQQERFSAVANGSGFPLALGDQLSAAGINGMTGLTSFSINLSGDSDGSASGSGDLRITQAQISRPTGTLAEAVDTAVRQAENITLNIQYAHWTDRGYEFKLTTNITNLIAGALRVAAEEYAIKAMDEIEKLLREYTAQYIDGRFASKDGVDALFRIMRGHMAAIDQLKNSLNTKKTELEQQVKAAAGQAARQVTDGLREQGQQVQNVLLDNMPSLPRLPGR
jgi:uncharacterized protein (TIGR03545 family)